jgi:hypothetical protein
MGVGHHLVKKNLKHAFPGSFLKFQNSRKKVDFYWKKKLNKVGSACRVD